MQVELSEARSRAVARFYRPELDVVRFIAFLAVYLDHTLPRTDDPRIDHLFKGLAPTFYAAADASAFGLSLFFVLSAFLICELLLRELQASRTVKVKQFYIRRILRIWPLYYFGLALGVVFALLPGGHRNSLAPIGWFAVFGGSWFCALSGWIQNPIVPLWSISVEEQFYLFAPWIVKYFNRKMLYAFCLFLLLIANGQLYSLGWHRVNGNRVWCDSFVQLECFAAGILLCLSLRGRVPRIVAWQRLALIAGALSFCFFACFCLNCQFEYSPANPGGWPLIGGYALAAAGSVMILIAFLGIAPSALPGWAIYLGRISFGLYVYHEFAISIVNRAQIGRLLFNSVSNYPLRICLNTGLTLGLPLGLTLLAAVLSYRYLETPFLRMKMRHSVIESQPIVGIDPALPTRL
jgi:peptidoglycan/LPS O-acetylase OafA/YrhL